MKKLVFFVITLLLGLMQWLYIDPRIDHTMCYSVILNLVQSTDDLYVLVSMPYCSKFLSSETCQGSCIFWLLLEPKQDIFDLNEYGAETSYLLQNIKCY